MYILLGINDVLDVINNALRGLWGNLCEIIYPMIGNAYKIFLELGTLAVSNEFQEVYNKVSLIIGIFMVFRVTFWLIENLVNPDTLSDKEKNPGKIIQKVLISIILLATVPTIFEYAIKLQTKITTDGVIEQIILPSSEVSQVPEERGRYIAADLFKNFYTKNVVEGQSDDSCDEYIYIPEQQKGLHYEDLVNFGKFNLTNSCLTDKELKVNGKNYFVIDFNGIFAVGVGAFVLWTIAMYCISLGTRYIQMIFLRIIAPIPIMCYLTPKKDNMFSKWVNQCTTTYLDLFIRIAIINFAVVLSGMLLNNENGLWEYITDSSLRGWIQVFLILGILTFAKKAPDLIQELLPKSMSSKASGDFGLSLKKRAESMYGGKFMYSTLKRAPGYVAGGVVGSAVGLGMGIAGGKGAGSRFMGGLSGMARGFATGSKKGSIFKNIGDVRKNQAAHTKKLQEWRYAAGKGENDPNTWGDFWQRKRESFKQNMGYLTESEKLKIDTERAQTSAKAQKELLEYGKGEAIKNNQSLKAFGVNRGLNDLKSISDLATSTYQNTNEAKLLSTDEGTVRLKESHRKQFFEKEARAAGKTSEREIADWIQKNKSTLETTYNNTEASKFDNLSDSERYALAEYTMEELRINKQQAEETFKKEEKRASFLNNVAEYGDNHQNVVNEFEKIKDYLKLDPEFLQEVAENYKKENGEDFTVTEFDPQEMQRLMKTAENDTLSADVRNNARKKLNQYYTLYDSYKYIGSKWDAKNASPEAKRNEASRKYNSDK